LQKIVKQSNFKICFIGLSPPFSPPVIADGRVKISVLKGRRDYQGFVAAIVSRLAPVLELAVLKVE